MVLALLQHIAARRDNTLALVDEAYQTAVGGKEPDQLSSDQLRKSLNLCKDATEKAMHKYSALCGVFRNLGRGSVPINMVNPASAVGVCYILAGQIETSSRSRSSMASLLAEFKDGAWIQGRVIEMAKFMLENLLQWTGTCKSANELQELHLKRLFPLLFETPVIEVRQLVGKDSSQLILRPFYFHNTPIEKLQARNPYAERFPWGDKGFSSMTRNMKALMTRCSPPSLMDCLQLLVKIFPAANLEDYVASVTVPEENVTRSLALCACRDTVRWFDHRSSAPTSPKDAEPTVTEGWNFEFLTDNFAG